MEKERYINMEKVCLTTYIYGDQYQEYIPLMLYSVARSYPEYSIYIFINGSLRNDIKNTIRLIDKEYKNYEIIEHTFDDCPKIRPLHAKTLRWVLWDDRFLEYDYLYYIDSDILYVKEPISLHEQHMRHMEHIGSDCVSNISRKTLLSNTNYVQIVRTLVYAGPIATLKYFKAPFSMRMSGIHFVKTATYFKHITPELLSKYKKDIYSNNVFKKTIYANDESVLYSMMQEGGCDMSVFAIQNTSTSMFGFNEPEKKEFCPHHGVHLGIFRFSLDEMPAWAKEQLESDDYHYYIEKFKADYLSDPLFHQLYKYFSTSIKDALDKMYKYYMIDCNQYQ